MQCGKCGKEVPEGAVYCPFCAGNRSTSQREVIVGGIKGALIGLALGLVPGVSVLVIYGPVRGVKAIAFAVPMATFITGLIIGMVRAKQDWK